MQAARELADRINAGQQDVPGTGGPFQFTGAPDAAFTSGSAFGGAVNFLGTVTIGPDGQPSSVPMSAEAAAQLATVLRQALGGIMAPQGGFTPAEAAHMAGFRAREQGTAVVLGARDAPSLPGLPDPPGGRAELLLEVTRADGTTYQARTVMAFSTPEHRTSTGTAGTRLRVWIDPSAPGTVAVNPAGLF